LVGAVSSGFVCPAKFVNKSAVLCFSDCKIKEATNEDKAEDKLEGIQSLVWLMGLMISRTLPYLDDWCDACGL